MSAAKQITVVGVALLTMAIGVPTAMASGPERLQPNDVDLTGYIEFQNTTGDPDDPRVWGHALQDDDGFSNFARDLGQVFAPQLTAPSETLGQAGYAIKLKGTLSHVPSSEQYWSDGLAGGSPNSVLVSNHLHVRKGLPFSFEVGGNLTHLYNSQMFGMGGDLRWALHEGYRYFPDIAARVGANTVTGAPQLNLINLAWDISMSKSFGLGGVVQLTPYAGYQQLHTWGSSRVVNAYPHDPRPPQTLGDDGAGPSFSPEVVFDAGRQFTNRYFLGGRLNTWIMSFTVEAIFADPVNQFTFSAGVDF